MRKATPIQLSDEEKATLREWARDEAAPAQLRLRMNIILELDAGTSYAQISEKLGVSSTTAGKWKRRFLKNRLLGLRNGSPGRPKRATRVVKAAVVNAVTMGDIFGSRPALSELARDHALGRSTVHRIVQALDKGLIGGEPCEDGLDFGELVKTDGSYELVRVILRRFGRRFPFALCKRKLDMGEAGQIDYYWMDSSELRRGEGVNFRSCIAFWWAAMEFKGWNCDNDILMTRVFAESYRRLGDTRGTQKMFLDAHISRSVALPRGYSLPQDEFKRLRDIAYRRDVGGIRRELKTAFVREEMPEDSKDDLADEAKEWLGFGVQALDAGGDVGLQSWVDDWLIPKMAKMRKAGTRGGRKKDNRYLLNAWAYNAKISFYATYANAWGALIGEFEAGGLDVRSSRFMRLWHMQNPNERGEDVFWGQVLSLHPLTGRVMLHYWDHRINDVVSNSDYRFGIGKWLLRARPGAFNAADFDCDEYWEVVAVIMAAAREYVHLHDQSTTEKRTTKTPKRADVASDEKALLHKEELLDEYAFNHELCCPDCGKLLRSLSGTTTIVGDGLVKVTFGCSRCPHRLEQEIDLTVEPDELAAD